MRRVNRAFTNRLLRPVAAVVPPLAVVHHVGRKSGRAYRTPVLAFPVADGFLTPLLYGTDTDWCLNLVAAGSGTLEQSGRKLEVRDPRVIDGDAALPLLPGPLRAGLRISGLPGYLLVDRVPSGGRKKSTKPPGARSRRR
jgi:deazaflavin-dependent oxidoreductase (nitroreductase family)